jgi:hypothetical protein
MGYSFGFDNQQDIGPAGPEAAQRGPKQAVTRVQERTRSLAFENGDLLPKGEDLQGSIDPCAEENSEASRIAKGNWTMNSHL